MKVSLIKKTNKRKYEKWLPKNGRFSCSTIFDYTRNVASEYALLHNLTN